MPRYLPQPCVVCTVLTEGGVLLNLDTKFYYSLNPSGLDLWLRMESGGLDAASTPRLEEASSSSGREVEIFLSELVSEGLAVLGDGDRAGQAAGRSATAGEPLNAGLEPPRLIRHDVPLSHILSNPFDPCVPLAE